MVDLAPVLSMRVKISEFVMLTFVEVRGSDAAHVPLAPSVIFKTPLITSEQVFVAPIFNSKDTPDPPADGVFTA